jgi:hypothetical protein
MAQFAAESRRSESEAICGRLRCLGRLFDFDAARIARDASRGPEAESFVVHDEIAAFRRPKRLSPLSRHTPLSRDGRSGQYDLRKHTPRERRSAFAPVLASRSGAERAGKRGSADGPNPSRHRARPGGRNASEQARLALRIAMSAPNGVIATVFRNSFTEASRAPNAGTIVG